MHAIGSNVPWKWTDFRIGNLALRLFAAAARLSSGLGALVALLLTNVILRHPTLDIDNNNPTWVRLFVVLFAVNGIWIATICIRQILSRRWARGLLTLSVIQANVLAFTFLCFSEEYCAGLF